MRYCSLCGAYIPIDDTVCPACGHDAAGGGSAQRGAAQGQSGSGQAQATASRGYYQQEWSRETESRAQSKQTRGEYRAQDQSRRQYEEPWKRAGDRDPWSSGRGAQGSGRAWSGRGASPYDDARGEPSMVPDDIAQNRYLCILCYLGPLFLIPYLLRRDSPFVRFHANQGLVLFLFNALVQVAGNFVPFFRWAVGLFGGIFALVCFFKGLSSSLNGRFDKLPLIGDIHLLR